MKIILTFAISFIITVFPTVISAQTVGPVRVAVAGTAHGHSGWILGRYDTTAITVVGIYEKDGELLKKQTAQYKLNPNILYSSLSRMLDEVKPEAVVAFGSIFDHLMVVEACAPRGIHVMVEKPLAVSAEHARKMEMLAKKHRIHLLTNYETSWYPTTVKSLSLARDSNYVGSIKKAVFHHGHEGPKEIGVGPEFLQWLTDPVQNGGGALIDFGCYGANIMTTLMDTVRPTSITAVTAQYKPNTYPKVDDEATIVVQYPHAQAIIQASWNWPFGRKDMELYGDRGYVITSDATRMRKKNNQHRETADSATVSETGVYTDPFRYFADVIREKIVVPPYGLYSLENNLRVVEILDAARQSAKTGRSIPFNRR